MQLIPGIKHNSVSNYHELDLFREHVEQQKIAPHQQPYQAHRKQAIRYKIIFASFGVLFSALLALIYSKDLHWTHLIFFQDSQFLRFTAYLFCGVFSGLAFWAAAKVRPELEALHALRQRARIILRLIYQEKCLKLGVQRFLPQGANRIRMNEINQGFHEAWVQLNDASQVTLQLLTMISNTRVNNAELRIHLYNQAILELQDKYQLILKSYQA